ncbi:alginate lyase family protein [Galbibacter mesophilus]|uniref:alginate lyase family protein n=1 Tax=Galbibacter mesophilus TaxID=379069 RepID=UPI00191D33C1|nr:alginate lyase family protein [Galbibacter mesophilus]MCM5663896.1 alginate lyase family protein [Galbibacter mesophilus]
MRYFFLFILFLNFDLYSQNSVLDLQILPEEKLYKAKKELQKKESFYQLAYRELQSMADSLLSTETRTVMDKDTVPFSGNKHDYLSVGPYWWPNPKTSDGLPYVRRDGEKNPEIEKITDRKYLDEMMLKVKALSLAYFYSDDEVYAKKAVEVIETWFINPETKMNPHLDYGQAVPGRATGRRYGIIETRAFGILMDYFRLLERSSQWKNVEKPLKNWFADYVQWLESSKIGKLEKDEFNNHGTWHDVQAAGIYLYLGDNEKASEILKFGLSERLNSQVEKDGKQPHELARTRSFSYSSMNLYGFLQLYQMAITSGVEVAPSSVMKLKNAYKYLQPYFNDMKAWKYQQIIKLNEKNFKVVFLAEELFPSIEKVDVSHIKSPIPTLSFP